MSQTIRATDISLHDLETQFELQLSNDEQFFPEWQTDLPEITELDKQVMDRVKASYFNLVLANENQDKPCFGMITTGGSFVFIKLVKGKTPQYALSRVFELRNPGNELYTVLSVLKQLEQVALTDS
ncbi:MAG: hypothetical protein ABFS56_12215 [Pseudomonadota bacterium]